MPVVTPAPVGASLQPAVRAPSIADSKVDRVLLTSTNGAVNFASITRFTDEKTTVTIRDVHSTVEFDKDFKDEFQNEMGSEAAAAFLSEYGNEPPAWVKADKFGFARLANEQRFTFQKFATGRATFFTNPLELSDAEYSKLKISIWTTGSASVTSFLTRAIEGGQLSLANQMCKSGPFPPRLLDESLDISPSCKVCRPCSSRCT